MSLATIESQDVVDFAAQLLTLLRARAPKVHCITNTVAQPLTANALLAAGAIPSLTTSQEEIEAFAQSADSMLVNLGTLDAERRRAIELALQAIAGQHMRWVLDPVFVERSAVRLAFARTLIAAKPSVIRLNAAEFAALAGAEPDLEQVRGFARATTATVALTGERDVVSDGTRTVRLGNGHPLMSKVTAIGCASSALIAAALGVDDKSLVAAAAALLLFGIAGEIAGETSEGPGSFAVRLLDVLHGLTPEIVRRHARASDVD